MQPEYNRAFLGNFSANILMAELLRLPWLTVKDARREYFMSDVPRTYVYDREGYEYHSKPFHPLVAAVMTKMAGTSYNVCFLNRYDNQRDALGWHADDSPNVDPEHPIAVVSLGAEREIWWKPQSDKGEVPDSQKQRLENGSLFVMPAGFQQLHFHKIPKHSRPCGTRISLTFRRYI